VFIKGDRGEETKFGVAQAANPDLDIKKITLADAKKRYEEKYWNASKADQLQEPVSLLHFDAAVNHGVGRAVKFLQQALQVTVDGDIGPKTLAAAKSADQIELGKKLLEVRKNFFLAIVARDPSQKKFLNGWLNRIEQIKKTIKI
jgi:lysozyme family protein